MGWQRASIILGSFLLVLAALSLPGCGPGRKDFTPEEFKKVAKEMSEENVKEILGSPIDSAFSKKEGIKLLWWRVKDKVDEKYYSVAFKDGKAEGVNGPHKKLEYEMTKRQIIFWNSKQ